MPWLLLPITVLVVGVLVKLAVHTKLTLSDELAGLATRTASWKDLKVRDRGLNRIGNAVLLVGGGTLIGWTVGYLGAPSTVWPPVTLDNLAKLGPIATALAAVIALIVGGITVWQRTNADKRVQWWARTEFGLDWAFGEESSDPVRKSVGLSALDYQRGSSLAKAEEKRFLIDCVKDVISKVDRQFDEAYEAGVATVADVVLTDTEQPPGSSAGPDQEEGEGHD